MASKHPITKNTNVSSDHTTITKQQHVQENDTPITKTHVATKPTIKKHVSSASDRNIDPISVIKKDDNENETNNKNVSSASDHNHDHINVKKEDENDTTIKNVVASDHNNGCMSVKKGGENENETENDIGICLKKLNISVKKKLLVLPISGFLVHRAFLYRASTIPKNRQPDFSSGSFMIYKRPYCEEFLKFCFERFEMGIWSSAMEHNIGGVVDNVMGEFKSKLLFTWDQTQCTKTNFMCLDKKDKPVFLKELNCIWRKKDIYGEYSAANTLLISDPVKALVNPPNTAISLSSYDPDNNQDDLLGPNSELRVFLDGLAEAEDVQTFVKENPIGDPLITPSHTDWEYYSKIIRAYGKDI